jgi:hypothetical protein
MHMSLLGAGTRILGGASIAGKRIAVAVGGTCVDGAAVLGDGSWYDNLSDER